MLYLHRFLIQLGYRLHVIDSERLEDDISLSLFDEMLSLSEELGGAVPVMTIPVRRSDYPERLVECVEVLSQHNMGGVCIVAGNPAYLSVEERRRGAKALLIDAAERLDRLLMGRGAYVAMVGTENVERTAAYVASRYRITPFTLLDSSREGEVRWFREVTGMPVAVYVPYHVGPNIPEHALARARAYAARRMGDGVGEEVEEKIRQVTVMGGEEYVRMRLASLSSKGASAVVGYPLDENEEQLTLLIRSLNPGPRA